MTTATLDPASTAEGAPKPKKYVKPQAVDRLTGFCKSPDPDAHLHCKGSGTNGLHEDHLWFCPCECHVDHPTCRDCGQRDVEITLTGTCVDVDGCVTSRAVRTEKNPIHQQLRQIIEEAERRESERAAARSAQRAAQREREAAQAKAEGRPVPAARPVRTPKVPPEPQRCHCGCAGMTKGGRFVAGHDARLKGMLVRAARQTPPDSGKPATKKQAIHAMAELIARDWPRKGVDTEIARQAEAMFNQYGPDALIEAAVTVRYEGKAK